MRDFLLIVHIVGAGAWVGANLTQAVVGASFRDADAASSAAWARATARMATALYYPAGAFILATGIALVVDSSVYTFADPFVSLGLLVVLYGFASGWLLFRPKALRVAERLDANDRAGAAPDERVIFIAGAIDTVIIIATITAMVLKWGV